MSIYSVYEPPSKDGAVPDPARFVFVRDGFTFWAFLLGPVWMLWHRLWLVLAGYLIVATALVVVLRSLGVSASVMVVAGILLALLVGFEAATLRRFALARRRFRNVGIVVGDDLETAERRFFDLWVRQETRPAVLAPAAARAAHPAAPATEVIGLFPEPGAPR